MGLLLRLVGVGALTSLLGVVVAAEPSGEAWPLRVVDDTSEGADGVKLADINGDGLLDIITGWEEGGVVRGYRHPGVAAVRDAWPRIDVGGAANVEDAVWVDVDGDGVFEAVACSEGNTREVRVYRAHGETWWSEPVPALAGHQWMFAQPADIDGQHGVDLVIGAKNRRAEIGWLQAPADPFDLAAWRWHGLAPAGWIMSIWPRDIDGDGDLDVIYSDRRGEHAGVWWLERPNDPAELTKPWSRHLVWTDPVDLMSFDFGDIDGDGHEDLTLAVKDFRVIWLRRDPSAERPTWQPITIDANHNAGNTRAAEPGDLDGDGDLDIAVTTWISADKHGVFWLENDGSPLDGGWQPRVISGTERGIKYDHSELLDLDGDGDLDLLTCEEHEANGGLGVIWYENPANP